MNIRIIMIVFLTCMLGCTTGSALVTGVAREPIPIESVKIYNTYPDGYEIIGVVKSKSEQAFSEQSAVNKALYELKRQAAKIGANGILIISQGEQRGGGGGTFISNGYGGGSFIGSDDTYQLLSAEAIFVP